VTSSTTLPYGACSLGFSPFKIRDIWGVAKIYDTRSGKDPLFPDSLFDDKDLSKLGELGKEFGVTTGRRRHVNWLRLDLLVNAINISGANQIVINKCDVLQQLGVFKMFSNDAKELLTFNNFDEMKNKIQNVIRFHCDIDNIYFSSSKEVI
jgi:adenylosuccinate synthase